MNTPRALLPAALLAFLFAIHPACAKNFHPAKTKPTAGTAPAEYVRLDNVQFLRNAADDGDSFHVRAKGKEYIFRLYFVDTPETDASFPDRVAEQAAYFGITPEEAIRVGKMAEECTAKQLAGHPFTVYTRWTDAKGRSRLERFYAHIFIQNQTLAELLVANGLARVYGMHANLPDGTRAKVFEERLRALETKAKAAKLGAWGIRSKK